MNSFESRIFSAQLKVNMVSEIVMKIEDHTYFGSKFSAFFFIIVLFYDGLGICFWLSILEGCMLVCATRSSALELVVMDPNPLVWNIVFSK